MRTGRVFDTVAARILGSGVDQAFSARQALFDRPSIC
jgi:hypothetical protein